MLANKSKSINLKKQSKCFQGKGTDCYSRWDPAQAKKKRVMNYKLVQVQGIPSNLASSKILVSKSLFGKYGPIQSLYIANQRQESLKQSNMHTAYVCYQSQISSSLALLAAHNIEYKNHKITANFGTNRYCHSFLLGQTCQKNNCFYLHKFDSENEAHKAQHSKQKHLQKAFSVICKNIGKVIAMEFEEKKSNNLPVAYLFRSIQTILEKLIKKGLVNAQEYMKMKKKGKVLSQKIIMLNKNSQSSLVQSLPQPTHNSAQLNRKQSNQTSLSTQSQADQRSFLQEKQLSRSAKTLENQTELQESHSYLNEIIVEKILMQLNKRRAAPRIEFRVQDDQVWYEGDNQKTRKIRQKMIKSLMES